jgi:prepilin-type N-terminal cleavage/methylation domain-containing protein
MKRKRAFTLAETLITLAIIGVVAAITLPTLFSSITEMVNSNREANIAQKFSQAMDHMGALGLLDQGFSSTDEFVDELEKYIKVAKRCDSSHLDECWPTRYVTDSLGKTYDIKNAKTGNELKIFNNDTDNVGLVLTDGSSVILTYNEKYPGFDSGNLSQNQRKVYL